MGAARFGERLRVAGEFDGENGTRLHRRMTFDPYQTPSAPPAEGDDFEPDGRIDVGRAFADGWELMKSNLPTAFGMFVVMGLLSVVSVLLLIIPALFVIPALWWGFYGWMLDAYEGRGTFGQLFDGFSNLAAALMGFLPLFFAGALLALPGQALEIAAESADQPLLLIGASLLSIIANLITLRWSFAGFFIVERDMNGIDAIRASWRATKGQWFTVFILAMAAGLLMVVGVLLLLVGVIPAAAIATFAYVSAYRQLVGPPPA